MDVFPLIWDELIVQPLAQSLHLIAVPLQAAMSPGAAGALAIILVAVLVRLLLLPMLLVEIRSQRVLLAIRPELRALERKFGRDREGLARAQVALSRARGVNPVTGYLPVLLQLPILLGLYGAMMQLVVTDLPFRSAVLWLPSLGEADLVHVFGIGAPGPLLLLMTLASFFAQRRAPLPTADRRQRVMVRTLAALPLLYLLALLNAPAGLVLYWLANNLLALVQKYVAGGSPPGRLKLTGFDRGGPEPPGWAGRGARLPWRPLAP